MDDWVNVTQLLGNFIIKVLQNKKREWRNFK